MGELKLVIFDVDGTLVDSQAEIIHAMIAAYDAINVPIPARDQLLSVVGLSLAEAFGVLLPDADQTTIRIACDTYKDAYNKNRIAGAKPIIFDGMEQILTDLACDPFVLLGIATGKSRRGLDGLMDQFGWTCRFVTTQVSDDHPSKPHPSMIFAALSETGVAPQNAVMIGDTTYDIAMAQAAGVSSIGVSWGYHGMDKLGQADRVVRTVPELRKSIWELLGK